MLWQSMHKLYINAHAHVQNGLAFAHAHVQNGLAFKFCCQTAEEFCSTVRLQMQGL